MAVRVPTESSRTRPVAGQNNRNNLEKPPPRHPFQGLLLGARRPQSADGPKELPRDSEVLPPPELRPRKKPLPEEPVAERSPRGESATLDPLVCALSRPGLLEPAPIIAPPRGPLELPMELLLERLVKKVAWGGSGRRGTARLELGAGSLAGATVTVHADDAGEVSVELELPPGARSEAWHDELAARLERRGLVVKSVSIR